MRLSKTQRNFVWATLGTVVSVALLIQGVSGGKVSGQESNSRNLAERSSRGQVALETQLINGLRVAFPQQKVFISNVVQLVNQGKISRSMVNTVYTWSIRRNPRIPFPYFEFAMRALAQRRGVAIP
jgi:hypothetical protein